MNGHKIHRSTQVWHRAAVTALAITGALIATGATATVDARESGPDRNAPIWEQVAEQQELHRIVAMMPTGWPATDAMRMQAAQPLGDVAQRAHWRRTVELMPAAWPATNVMRAELER